MLCAMRPSSTNVRLIGRPSILARCPLREIWLYMYSTVLINLKKQDIIIINNHNNPMIQTRKDMQNKYSVLTRKATTKKSLAARMCQ